MAGRTLVRDGSFAIERGDRVALIGPNGAGKTTLLETLIGAPQPQAGRIKIGHNVTLGYYSQQSLELPDAHRAIEVLTQGGEMTGPRPATCWGSSCSRATRSSSRWRRSRAASGGDWRSRGRSSAAPTS